MKRPLFTPILIAAALLWQEPTRADDIDIFNGVTSNATPNVLFIIDNTANWNQPFNNEMAALSAAFSSLPVNNDGSARFNIGIMFSTETGNGNSDLNGSKGGGYVRAAIRPMTTANRALYANLINSLNQLADKANGGDASLDMAEAWLYFSGGAPYAGNGKVKTDYSSNLSGPAADNAVWALPGNALGSESATKYNPPPLSSGCTKTFIIYISNGPNQDQRFYATANSMLAAAGGDTTTIPISPVGSMADPSDEWARFMHQSNLGVVTYTIDVNPPATGQGPGWSALLKSMASVSTGKYQAVLPGAGGTVSTASISQAILADLSEIQAVNSVYASVSLPASSNTQGTYLNQVFIGMFRPDANAAPRWYGNLKQYQLGFIGNMLRLEDADQKSAINNQTGFITECARSFWSPTSADTYWTFFPEGVCIPPAGSAANTYQNSNYPDGNIVEKGGEGYVLRNISVSVTGTDARTMYTSAAGVGSGSTTLTGFNASNATLATALTAQPPDKVSDVINWERGEDIQDENINKITTEMRPSVHGDVVHSRPVAINYGTASAPNVVVYYGGNDGALRAVNGNQSTAAYGAKAGAELWSFVPPEFYPAITRLYYNKPLISFPNVSATGLSPPPQPKSYGMDGPMTAYSAGSSTWLYAPMRRGGRVLYAFDVSNPASPTMKWKAGCPNNFSAPGVADDTGCSLKNASGIGAGQTWGSAKVISAAGYGGGSKPLIIMGGGYDTCEDNDPNTCTAATHGNTVYVLDANDGSVQATLPTIRAVIADVAIVPDPSGLALYGYVADLGGNVYRITMGSNAPANWSITQIAALGCAPTVSCSANRKFMFGPDVVSVNGIYTVLLGSGDREKPLRYDLLGSPSGSVVNSVTNYFFAVEDNPTSSTWLSAENVNCGASMLCLNSLLPITSSTPPTSTALAAKKGWYLSLNQYEQVVTSAITIYGTVYFSTHVPAVPPAANSPTCASSLGTTRLYTVNFSSPTPHATIMPPVGLPPSPTAGLVNVGSQIVPFCIGCSADSPEQSTEPQAAPGTVPAQPKSRVYWYLQR